MIAPLSFCDAAKTRETVEVLPMIGGVPIDQIPGYVADEWQVLAVDPAGRLHWTSSTEVMIEFPVSLIS